MSKWVATPRTISNAHASRASLGLGETAWVSPFVCLGYYITAKLGFAFALQPGSVSTLWMPNAILLAGMLLTPGRHWPILVLTTLPAHLAAELQSNVPLAMVLSWFFSNSLQALIAAMSLGYLIDALIRLNGWGAGPYWDVWRVRFLSNKLLFLRHNSQRSTVEFIIEATNVLKCQFQARQRHGLRDDGAARFHQRV